MPTARALARRFGAELRTISVTSSRSGHDRLIAAAVAELGPGADESSATVVTAKDVAGAISTHADELGSCLICLSSRSYGRLTGAVFTSVARSLRKLSGAPLMIVGPRAERPAWSRDPRGWPPPLTTDRIVACVDGSSDSELVLPWAAEWARALEKSLTVLTVIDDVPEAPRAGLSPSPDRTTEGAWDYVDGLVRRWREVAPRTDGLVIRDPIGPASAIRSHLAEHPTALVALTAPDRSGLRRVRNGAIAEDIVRKSTAPCLVVPR
jgi:nucleotide-binding universal stress UspA family protein